MVSLFPTLPAGRLNIAGENPLRRRSPTNFLERAKEQQNSRGQLGTGGFGGTNSAPLDELSELFDTATQTIFDPKADSPTRELDRAQAAAPVARQHGRRLLQPHPPDAHGRATRRWTRLLLGVRHER